MSAASIGIHAGTVKVGRAFHDEKRGGWVVHVRNSQATNVYGILTDPIRTRWGFTYFRLATKAERDKRLAEIAASEARAPKKNRRARETAQ